jgi:glycosyltransferase involved in cell wall biosynthesis
LKPVILFVATTPFAVNPFLTPHMVDLSKKYTVVLCVNMNAYELLPWITNTVKVVHIPFVRKMAPLTDFRNLIQLIWLVWRVKPSVIHSITPKAGLLSMMAGFLNRIPNRWHTFTGQVWVTKRGLGRVLLKAFDKIIVMLSSMVFADSHSQCRYLVKEGLVRSNDISVLGEGSIAGVDLERFQVNLHIRKKIREYLGARGDACVFLFLGRLSLDKGVYDLVQAFLHLTESVGPIELWMVGPDEDGLLTDLQKKSSGCGFPIRWLGKTLEPEKYMASADVLVLPSYREGFGSVIIEAAACGNPAIAYRIDGVIDAIVDGVTGVLVEVGSVHALSNAIETLSRDVKLRTRLGRQARERVEKHFCSQTITAAWMKHYGEYLGN